MSPHGKKTFRIALALLAIAVAAAGCGGAASPLKNGKIAFVRGGDLWLIGAHGNGLTRLTRTAAKEDNPNWSPDGKRIAFVRGGNLWLIGAHGSGLTQLTKTTAKEDNPSWSPDGKKIAFDRGGDLWLIGADGSGLTQLTTTGYSGSAWSRDGKKLAYVVGNEIWVANADGSGAVSITASSIKGDGNYSGPCDSDPSWSPDGKQIVFEGVATATDDCQGAQAGYGGSSIYVMTPSGASRRALDNTTGTLTGDYRPQWRPDGQRILFLQSDSAGMAAGPYYSNLFVLDARAGKIVGQLTDRRSTSADVFSTLFEAGWSPDGKQIAYQDEKGRVSVMSATGKHKKGFGFGSDITWSPDGKQIAYVANTPPKGKATTLTVTSADGSKKPLILECDCSYDWQP
jgi:Tol biopolymer transport system component